ncbi:hypothetical protein A9993_04250 [Rahnella victoriana]|uniref:hypothetical protein n=1 Tax=Rahnella victoriana TaxID=1510570 RepID=UPI000BB1E96C|nr:hypothetical protein [Rahnella victoriana]PBI78981.1 hypothetical protein A9993_04250 [Rahnella victoriana]
MIAISIDARPTYLPTTTNQLRQIFAGLVKNGTSLTTRSEMVSVRGHRVAVHKIRYVRNSRGDNKMNLSFHDEVGDCELDLQVLKKSIESPTTIRPDWVKTGKDFVTWMKMRKGERLNVTKG